MPSETHRARKVLVIYINAPEDDDLRERLDRHLSPLKRRGLIEGWSTANIPPGNDKDQTLSQHLNEADIILLLISADFIASDYCYTVEMKSALARHEAGSAMVIPILLRPTNRKGLPIENLQWLPTSAAAVTLWSNIDQALSHIADSIDEIIQRGEQPPSTHPSLMRSLWTVPYRDNPFFSGRQRHLDLLRDRFTIDRDSHLAVQAITGLPGVGKTELALEYASRYRHEYEAIFWLRCDSPKDLLTSLLQIADLLQLPIENSSEEQNIATKVKQRLAYFSGQWLLIFDNMLEIRLIDHFIPTGANGDVLITTTESTMGALAHSLPLLPMSEEEGAHFLLTRASINAADAEQFSKAKEISELVGGLPLALDQAGAYIEGTKKSLADYIQNYRTHLNERGLHTAIYHSMSVTATFAFCFEQVKKDDPIASEILHLCAFLHADAIPERVFISGVPELGPILQSLSFNRLEEAIQSLQRYSLVSRDNGKLGIHRLIQFVLQDEMDEKEKLQWQKRTVHAVDAIFPEAEFAVWPLCRDYLPQVQACAELMKQHREVESSEGARLLDRAGYYLYERSQYAAARSFFEQALQIQQRVPGLQHADTARTLYHLGALSRSLGQHHEAAKYYKDAHTILKALPNQEPLAITWILDGQGELAQTHHKYLQAQRLYKQAFAIRKLNLIPPHPDIAISLANLAGIYEAQGNFSRPGPLYEQALAIYEQAVVPDHPDVALILSNFARFCGIQKEYERAEEHFERAKAMRERIFGFNHPKVAGTLHNLANFYIDLADHDKDSIAEEYIRRALAIWQQAYGTQIHPNVAASLRVFAKLYRKQRQYSDAQLLYKQALTIYQHVPEPEPLDIAQVHRDLEELYQDQQQHNKIE